MFRVNQEKCIGCGVCLVNCPGATELGEDGKAKIIDEKKLQECDGEAVCPFGAIEKTNKSKNDWTNWPKFQQDYTEY